MGGSPFPEEIAGAARFAWGAPAAIRNDVPFDDRNFESERSLLHNQLTLRSRRAAKGQSVRSVPIAGTEGFHQLKCPPRIPRRGAVRAIAVPGRQTA